MKKIAEFLLAVFSCAPLCAGAAPISTTAGSNLTGYNGAMGSVVGNQWNTVSNPRANTAGASAKADFGNCNAVILRCATPKCSGGGCTNIDVAKPIVAGCVNSNATCKKHGNDLIDYIAAQLVADSVAAQNNQAAAAAAAAEQNAQQMAQMQQQMSQQMAQMQEQNNAQIASLQNALAESQRATAEAVQAAADQAAASAASASTPDANTGLTAVQTAAAKSGVSEEVIARSTITGQILTSMEGVDTSLNNLKTTMRTAFKYGGCNEVNGDNCTGPKRVKKFKELANKFFDPYDALVDNLDDALTRAQSVGVDLSDIYMMLNGSCNRWGEYLCQAAPAYYDSTNCKGGKSLKIGRVKKANLDCVVSTTKKDANGTITITETGSIVPPEYDTMCVLNKEIGEESVKESWLYPENDEKIRIGCASSALDGSILGRRRAAGKKGGIDIDVLEHLINQDAPNAFGKNKAEDEIAKYCAAFEYDDNERELERAAASKTLGKNICCSRPGVSVDKGTGIMCTDSCEDEENVYVAPAYGLCNVHAYNAGKTSNDFLSSSADKERMKRIIGLKTTVIAQQMYKQYSMVEAMIKRIKIMLEKATLKASLQVASGTSTSDDSSDSSSDDDISFQDCEARSSQSALDCVRSNYSAMKPLVEKNKLKPKLKEQMESDYNVLLAHLDNKDFGNVSYSCQKTDIKNKDKANDCLKKIMAGITQLDNKLANKSSGSGAYTITFGNKPD